MGAGENRYGREQLIGNVDVPLVHLPHYPWIYPPT